MSGKGFVYAGILSEKDLRSLLERLKVILHLCWGLAELKVGEGLPEVLRDRGTASNRRCEVRWERISDGKFRVLVLSDESQDLPLSPVKGEWTTEEGETQLWNLEEVAISPSLDRYPLLGEPVGRLRCRVFYRDGMAVFVSPREVLKDAASAS